MKKAEFMKAELWLDIVRGDVTALVVAEEKADVKQYHGVQKGSSSSSCGRLVETKADAAPL